MGAGIDCGGAVLIAGLVFFYSRAGMGVVVDWSLVVYDCSLKRAIWLLG